MWDRDRNRAFAAFGVLAALGLGACSQVTVNSPASNPRYFPKEELYAARNGAIRVEVAGDTLGVAHGPFAQQVVDEMRRGNPGLPQPGFATQGSRMTDPTYKIVMMFGPPTWLSANELCTHRPPPPVPHAAGQRLELLAAFCRSREASSEARGSAPVSAAGVADPNFAALVRQVALNLFPAYSDTRIPDGGTGSPP